MIAKTTYRPDIDGLRAIAVLSVVLYHYGAKWLPGGFTGVDIFFVISGFLITSILRDNLHAGRFSIADFYGRRLRRIVPPLLLVITASIVAGWFILMPAEYASLGESSAYAALGLANIYFYHHTGYFDLAAELQPLLHTWSLGVEEQFYFFWPALLWLGHKVVKSRRLFAACMATLAAVLFAYAVRKLGTDPSGAFYLPFPRSWELATGALIAFAPPMRSNWAPLARALGLGLVCWSLLKISASDPFPGVNALFACSGAALIVWPATKSTIVTTVLASARWSRLDLSHTVSIYGTGRFWSSLGSTAS